MRLSLIVPCLAIIAGVLFLAGGCSNAYYGVMEKAGIHKRDIMVDRVEQARNSQKEAQQQFKSALEHFDAVVSLKETDLKTAFENLNAEYEDSRIAADQVSNRIDRVEDVAEALFQEWEGELELYQNQDLRRGSRKQLNDTKALYREMLKSMHRAEQSMEPVLKIFRDNVLFLKHNLNAQAIGALQGEFAHLKGEIDTLIQRMNAAIESSDAFIAEVRR